MTTKTSYTPGPWEVGKVYESDKNWFYVNIFSPAKNGQSHSPRSAEAVGITKEEAESNARLISAAPELLQALKDLVGEINLSKLNVKKDFHLLNVHACASKAIFNAEGR